MLMIVRSPTSGYHIWSLFVGSSTSTGSSASSGVGTHAVCTSEQRLCVVCGKQCDYKCKNDLCNAYMHSLCDITPSLLRGDKQYPKLCSRACFTVTHGVAETNRLLPL